MNKRRFLADGFSATKPRPPLLLRAFASFVVALPVAFGVADAADVVRYLAKTDSGAYEERSVEGEATSVDRDGVAVESTNGEALDANPIPAERVLWIQYQDAPMELSAARVESEVGNYEEALSKLDGIGADASAVSPEIATEIDWLRAYASLQLSLTGAAPLKDGGSAMTRFAKNHEDSWHYYESQRLLGAALYALSGETAKKDAREKNLEAARAAYSRLLEAKSETIQAIGKLGLAKIAFDEGGLDDAKALFDEVARREGQEPESSEARIGLARVQARQGEVDEAAKTLNDLLKVTPNDATLRQARVYNALGDVYADAGRPREAVLAYLHVDLLYPAARTERVAALKALVEQWRKLGREDRAQETVERLRERFRVEVQ